MAVMRPTTRHPTEEEEKRRSLSPPLALRANVVADITYVGSILHVILILTISQIQFSDEKRTTRLR